MAWMYRSTTDYKDCLDQVRQFLLKDLEASAVSRVTGSAGRVYGASATENSDDGETFTITCTTGGGDGVAKFSVVGDDSHTVLAEATAGVPYSEVPCSFIIVADGDTFSDSGTVDVWTFTTDSSTALWSQLRYTTGTADELILKGVGGGSDEIFVGYQTVTNGTTYWNWEAYGFTGWESGNTIENQPGATKMYDTMNFAPFDFYVIFTARHIKVIPILDNGHMGGTYLGWLLPHATPSQWVYPMFIGGSADQNLTIDNTSLNKTCYWSNSGGSTSYDTARIFDGSEIRNIYDISPAHYGSFTSWRAGMDGNMRLYPATPVYETVKNVFGVLEGVYWPTQYIPAGGVLTSGNVLVQDDIVAVTFTDTWRVGAGWVIAMDLMGDI